MKQQVSNCIKANPAKNGAFSATFLFPASFSGFDGHFPGQPVLPGVCLIQAVLVAAEQALGKKLEMKEMVLAKFIAVALPNETLTAECKVTEDMVRAKIARGEDRIAEIRLRVRDA